MLKNTNYISQDGMKNPVLSLQKEELKRQISFGKQRIWALCVTGVIGISGFVGNHYLKTKYDMNYILSNSSTNSGFHMPDWNNEDVFLIGVFSGMEYLKRID